MSWMDHGISASTTSYCGDIDVNNKDGCPNLVAGLEACNITYRSPEPSSVGAGGDEVRGRRSPSWRSR
jgi:hypothetical protein